MHPFPLLKTTPLVKGGAFHFQWLFAENAFTRTIARNYILPWWCHQMETVSAILAICAGNSPVTGEFPAQRPVTRSFDVLFHPRLNKRLRTQSWGCWFKTLSCQLWRHGNDNYMILSTTISLPFITGTIGPQTPTHLKATMERVMGNIIGSDRQQ